MLDHNNDNGKDSKSKKYMWLYMSETDGYSGYNSVSEAKRIYCLAHMRRKFHEIIVNLNEEALKESRALIGFNYCGQIYKLEKELRDNYSNKPNYYDIRYKERNSKLAPILDDFMKHINKEIPLAFVDLYLKLVLRQI